MKPLESQFGFDAVLRAEHAVVFVHFPWSSASAALRATVEGWEKELAAASQKQDWGIYLLIPDEHPFTWQWVAANLNDREEPGAATGTVLWLQAGVVAGRTNAEPGLDVRRLAQLTAEHFNRPRNPEDPRAGIDAELLAILCCPETHQSLATAPSDLVDQMNRQIAAGALRNRAGHPVSEKMESGLVRADGRFLYPVRHHIPIMLVDEAIAVAP